VPPQPIIGRPRGAFNGIINGIIMRSMRLRQRWPRGGAIPIGSACAGSKANTLSTQAIS
jgi:hypothetical protein